MTKQIARKIKLGESISDKTHQALRDLGWADPNDIQDFKAKQKQIEKENNDLREIVRELADQEIHENDLDASYVRTSLIVKARRILGQE